MALSIAISLYARHVYRIWWARVNARCFFFVTAVVVECAMLWHCVYRILWSLIVCFFLRSHSNFMLCTPNQITHKKTVHTIHSYKRVYPFQGLYNHSHKRITSEHNVEHSTSLHNTQHSSNQKKIWRKEPVLKCVSAAFYVVPSKNSFLRWPRERQTEKESHR